MMFSSKRGAELSLNTVIVMIIALIVIVMVIIILSNYGSPLLDALRGQVNTSIEISNPSQLKP